MFKKLLDGEVLQEENELVKKLKEKVKSQENLINHYRKQLETVTAKLTKVVGQLEIAQQGWQSEEKRRINATAVAWRRKRKLEKLEAQNG